MKWDKWRIGYAALGAAFLIFIIFFAPASLYRRYMLYREQKSIDDQIEHYGKQIETTEERLYELTQNDTTLERYAREVYHMQTEDETVFLVEETEE